MRHSEYGSIEKLPIKHVGWPLSFAFVCLLLPLLWLCIPLLRLYFQLGGKKPGFRKKDQVEPPKPTGEPAKTLYILSFVPAEDIPPDQDRSWWPKAWQGLKGLND